MNDLLAGDLARGAFQLGLADMRQRWGADAFAEVKARYEAQRWAANAAPRGR